MSVSAMELNRVMHLAPHSHFAYLKFVSKGSFGGSAETLTERGHLGIHVQYYVIERVNPYKCTCMDRRVIIL
jgi:hypothetical protein